MTKIVFKKKDGTRKDTGKKLSFKKKPTRKVNMRKVA